MITIKKLKTLPISTKLRKIIKLLRQFEESMAAGKETDTDYATELFRIIAAEQSIPGNIRTAAKKAESKKAQLQFRRNINTLRHMLRDYFGLPASDWDMVIPGTRNLDPSKRMQFPFQVYLDDIRSPFNVGSVFRTAEAFGVTKLLLSPNTANPDHTRARRTAQGSIDILPWEYADNKMQATLFTGAQNVFSLESGGQPIQNFPFPQKGIAIIGSEELGVSPELLRISDDSLGRVSIPLYGSKASLNVSVSFGVLMQSWTTAVNRYTPNQS